MPSLQGRADRSVGNGRPRDRRRAWCVLPARIPGVLGVALSASMLVGLAACGGGSGAHSTASAPQLVSAAVALEKQGNTNGAGQLLAQAIRKDPRYALAHYNLGYLDQVSGRAAAAVSQYQTAFADDPHLVSALFNEATLFNKSQPGRAMTLYRKVIKLQPEAPTAYLNLGFLELAAHQQAAGVHDLLRALEQQPALAKRLTKAQLAAVGRALHASRTPGATSSP
jgi:Tfp pilus assembly protein PilF